MKLLSKSDVKKALVKENQGLIETNIRLRKLEKEGLDRLNTAKDNYGDDKVKALRDFDKFNENLNRKKSERLKELNDINEEIESRRDLLDGIILKQDTLMEKEHELREREEKVSLREQFVMRVEQKINDTLPQTTTV